MKTFIFFIAILSMSFKIQAASCLPPELIVLKMPEDEIGRWREISRSMTKFEGLVEFIPWNEKTSDWTDAISVQFFKRSVISSIKNVDELVNLLHEQVNATYAGRRVIWKILKRNENDILFEWFLPEAESDSSSKHEIARVFLTEQGMHRIGVTHNHERMGPREREKWMRKLYESVAVYPQEQAKKLKGLSLIEREEESLELGAYFKGWRVVDNTALNGYVVTVRIPPWHPDGEIKECLEVARVPNLSKSSIKKIYEAKKKGIQEKNSKKVSFSVLKKSDNEVIYSFAYPNTEAKLQINGIVRTFLSGDEYYTCSYVVGLPKDMPQEDKLKWKERLEIIKTKSF